MKIHYSIRMLIVLLLMAVTGNSSLSENNFTWDRRDSNSDTSQRIPFPEFSFQQKTEHAARPVLIQENGAADDAWIVLEDYIMDDTIVGNGNGKADYGETIRVLTAVKNYGPDATYSVSCLASENDEQAEVEDEYEYYGRVDPQEIVWGINDLVFSVSGDCDDEHSFDFQLLFRDYLDSTWVSTIPVTLHAPGLVCDLTRIHDSNGDNDGILDSGESADIYLTAVNEGSGRADDLSGFLSTADPYVNINIETAEYPDIPPGNEAENTGPFHLSVAPDCPEGHIVDFEILFWCERGYSKIDSFSLWIGAFSDDIESGEGDWEHYAVTAGYLDQWHISSQNNHTPDGSYSWKCGSTGSGDYANHDDAGLQTPPVRIGVGAELSFWHWIEAETKSSEYAYDGGIVEISTDEGSSWEQIFPDGGYPYKSASCSNPFDPETPCYSGSYDWNKQTFDLSSYFGNILIRFRFGTDSSVTREGWYIDDLVINTGSGYSLSIEILDNPSSALPGETVQWEISVTNNGSACRVDYWLTASQMGGRIFDIPIGSDVFIPEAFQGSRWITFTIHNHAPPGMYSVINRLGDFPDVIAAEASFELEILDRR